jgi:hypothetical protein
MPELQQVRDLVGLPSAQVEVLDRDPDQCSLVMLSVFSKGGHGELPRLHPDSTRALHADVIAALSMIGTVFEATLLRRSGIAFLTKTRPGTVDIPRYGSRYVDLSKAETISVLEDLSPPLGSIMTGAQPTPNRGMASWTNPHPNMGTPLDLSMLMRYSTRC